MPDWWPILLLFVFATHGPFFAWRWRRTGEARFLATSITFALLALTYALRVFAEDESFRGISLFWWVRVPAWLSAVFSIGLFLRHQISRRKQRQASTE